MRCFSDVEVEPSSENHDYSRLDSIGMDFGRGIEML